MALTEAYHYNMELSEEQKAKWALADQHIFSRWREALGGSVRGIISGAASLSIRITQLFRSAGIDLREGYGLTETSPGLSLGREGASMLSAVGPAVEGVELMTDESEGNYAPGEREILASSPNIMMGYYNNLNRHRKPLEKLTEKDGFAPVMSAILWKPGTALSY